MKKKRSLYEKLIGTAVQCKRIINGTYDETKYTKYLESIQYLPLEELKKLQAEKLCAMMKHAVENITFYKPLKDELELTPESAFSDIKKFPILTKQMVSADPKSFIDSKIPVDAKLKTGGTTNINIEVIRDKSSRTLRNDEYFNRMIGIYPGMSRLILSRHERNYLAEENEIIEYCNNPISRTYRIKPMPLTKEKINNIYKKYVSKKPKLLLGNMNTIFVFARHVENNNLKIPRPWIIRTSGSKLSSVIRGELQRVFGARVFDSYGASEINFVSSECEIHEGMHYVPVSHYVEILKENGDEANDGEVGSMIITSLVHKAMPIIRYRIGDYGSVTNEPCKCKRTFPLIKSVDDREIGVIKTDSGALTVKDMIKIFDRFGNITDYQLVQTSSKTMRLNLVHANDSADETEENEIVRMINNILGSDIKIEISYVSMIPFLPNAKTLRVIPMTYDPQIIEKMLTF